MEQSAVAQHGMHDDRKAAGESHAGLLQTTAFAIFIARVFRAKAPGGE